MKNEYYKQFAENYEEMNNVLYAMGTYSVRHRILIDKILENYELPPMLLEEVGEFLMDWGNSLTRFAELHVKECNFVLELLENIDDD